MLENCICNLKTVVPETRRKKDLTVRIQRVKKKKIHPMGQ